MDGGSVSTGTVEYLKNKLKAKKENTKMCMASVWIKKGTREENLLEEVAVIKLKGEKLILSTLLGEEKLVEAKIEKIDFMNSKVLLTKR